VTPKQATVSGDALSIFVPISKFDEEKGIAWGYAAEEAPDRAGEILDFEQSKPSFTAWSESQKVASGGKSLGNVRLMHTTQAVGKVNHLEFLDDEKRVFVGIEITNEQARKDAAAGVLTGFSIGGNYAKKWKDGNLVRYVPTIQEISLVDRPCMPGATFTAVKADGVTEERPLIGRQVTQVWICPTVGHRHVAKADAVSCSGPTAEEIAKAAADELAAGQALRKTAIAELRKGMYDIGLFAGAVATIDGIRRGAKWEAEFEGDDSPVPAALATEVEHLSEILLQMVEEETGELLADVRGDGAQKWTAARVAKLLSHVPAEKRIAGTAFLKKAADALERAGMEDSEMNPEELKKVVGESVSKAVEDAIAKSVVAPLQKIDERIAAVEKSNTELKADVEAVKKATPAPSKLLSRVTKIDDGKTDPEKPVEKKAENVIDLTRDAFRKGVAVDPRITAGG
jgi:hypothetical protein